MPEKLKFEQIESLLGTHGGMRAALEQAIACEERWLLSKVGHAIMPTGIKQLARVNVTRAINRQMGEEGVSEQTAHCVHEIVTAIRKNARVEEALQSNKD